MKESNDIGNPVVYSLWILFVAGAVITVIYVFFSIVGQTAQLVTHTRG